MYSPDSSKLCSGSWDRTAILWDVMVRWCLALNYFQKDVFFFCVCVSPGCVIYLCQLKVTIICNIKMHLGDHIQI